MRHLKTYKLFELKDDTYLSAADRLQRHHPERSKKLRKWVDDKQSVDIDYIDPRPLNAMGNVYYITDVEVQTPNQRQTTTYETGNTIIVRLVSVNDEYTLIISNWKDESNIYNGLTHTIITYGTPWGPPGYNKKIEDPSLGLIGNEFPQNFYFSDRKSARIFMDVVEKESGEKLLFTINDIYKS